MFNKDNMTMGKLTFSINKRTAFDTFLSRQFSVERLNTATASVERGASGLELIDPTARGVVAPDSTLGGINGRAVHTIASVKLGRVVNIAAGDIQDVRAFGEEDEMETFETVLAQHTNPVTRSIDFTHENLRFGAIKGVQLASDGVTPIFNFFNPAGVTAPDDVDIDFLNADRKMLQTFYADMSDYSRTGLGVNADVASDIVYVYGKKAWRDFRTSDAVAGLYERFQDGAVNRANAGGQRTNFEAFDAVHVPYFGASIEDDEVRAVPVGVPGLFRTAFTPLDNPEAANTLGLPLYATPEVLPYGKGYGIEIASLPIHYVTQPECLIGARSTQPVNEGA
jgi:hypothetical protein